MARSTKKSFHPTNPLPFPIQKYSTKYVGVNSKSNKLGITSTTSNIPTAPGHGPHSPPVRTMRKPDSKRPIPFSMDDDFMKHATDEITEFNSQTNVSQNSISQRSSKIICETNGNHSRRSKDDDIFPTAANLSLDASVSSDFVELFSLSSENRMETICKKLMSPIQPLVGINGVLSSSSPPPPIKLRPKSASIRRKHYMKTRHEDDIFDPKNRTEFSIGIAANANSNKVTQRPQSAGVANAHPTMVDKDVFSALSLKKARQRQKEINEFKSDQLNQFGSMKSQMLKEERAKTPYLIHDRLRGCKMIEPVYQQQQRKQHQKKKQQKEKVSPIVDSEHKYYYYPQNQEMEEERRRVHKSVDCSGDKENQAIDEGNEDEGEEDEGEDDGGEEDEGEGVYHKEGQLAQSVTIGGSKSVLSEESSGKVSGNPLSSTQEYIMAGYGWDRTQPDNSEEVKEEKDANPHIKSPSSPSTTITIKKKKDLKNDAAYDDEIRKIKQNKNNQWKKKKNQKKKKLLEQTKDDIFLKKNPILTFNKQSKIQMNPMLKAKEHALNAIAFLEQQKISKQLSNHELKEQNKYFNYENHFHDMNQKEEEECDLVHELVHELERKTPIQFIQKKNLKKQSVSSGAKQQAREEFKQGKPLTCQMIKGLPQSYKKNSEEDKVEVDNSLRWHFELRNLLATTEKGHIQYQHDQDRMQRLLSKKKEDSVFAYQGNSEPYLAYLRSR